MFACRFQGVSRSSAMRATLLLAVVLQAARGWQLGEICNGVNYSSMASKDMLRGKHLRVLDTKWAPYATPDPSAAKGWVGLDIDLLNNLSWLLGFTFQVHDMGYPGEGESWTDVALRAQHHGDLLASYWSPSDERRNGAMMFKGHLDVRLCRR